MTRRTTLLPLVAMLSLAVSGCSMFSPPEAASGTPTRLCENAADADPRIRDFWSTQSSNSNPSEFTSKYLAARARVVSECLRVRSGQPKGGVERPIR